MTFKQTDKHHHSGCCENRYNLQLGQARGIYLQLGHLETFAEHLAEQWTDKCRSRLHWHSQTTIVRRHGEILSINCDQINFSLAMIKLHHEIQDAVGCFSKGHVCFLLLSFGAKLHGHDLESTWMFFVVVQIILPQVTYSLQLLRCHFTLISFEALTFISSYQNENLFG